ncbi:hypothetical protein ACSZOI_05645 [Aeromonas caviae]
MTCFAAALPIPSHHLPGSALATGIRDALVASSFRAYVHHGASQGPDLELVALLRSLVLEVLTPPPVAELLPVHQPACAGGRWCVKGEDLVRFTGSELSCSDFVMAALGWAGHPVRVPWRLVRSWKVLGRLEGGVWLTLQELKAVTRFIRGWPGERLRRALA